MIKCFGQDDTSFSSNGDIVIQPFKALVYKTDNGDFYLELECSLDYLEYVIPNNIIVCNIIYKLLKLGGSFQRCISALFYNNLDAVVA